MGLKRFNAYSALIFFSLLGASVATSTAQAADEPSPFKFELHGIAGASFFIQSDPAFILNGQGPLLLGKETSGEGTTTGFDVRQTRLTFSVTGPQVLWGATTKALVETDFFNLAGPGGYGEISLEPRLRLAYAELNWGDTWLRAGQDWELLFNEFPSSLGHITFPVTYFAGLSGWRDAGVGIFHKFQLNDTSNIEAAIQIARSDWEAPFDFGESTFNTLNMSPGVLSGLPAFEGRVKWNMENGFLYVAGHWGQADGSKVANLLYNVPADNTVNANRNWTIVEGKVGGKYTLGKVTAQGDLYTGMNTTPLAGEEVQWYTNNDVHEWGGWLQLGYNITNELSIWGVYGTSHSNMDEVTSAGGGRYQNTVYGGMLLYRDGPFGFGPEVYEVETKSTLAAGTAAPDGVMNAVQGMFSGMYFF